MSLRRHLLLLLSLAHFLFRWANCNHLSCVSLLLVAWWHSLLLSVLLLLPPAILSGGCFIYLAEKQNKSLRVSLSLKAFTQFTRILHLPLSLVLYLPLPHSLPVGLSLRGLGDKLLLLPLRSVWRYLRPKSPKMYESRIVDHSLSLFASSFSLSPVHCVPALNFWRQSKRKWRGREEGTFQHISFLARFLVQLMLSSRKWIWFRRDLLTQ